MTPAACAKHRETRGLVLKLEPGISGRDDNAIYTACTSSESSCHVGIVETPSSPSRRLLPRAQYARVCMRQRAHPFRPCLTNF